MPMKSVLLRLEGPLQSWGTQGRFGIRDTDMEPSKSGVLGMVGAALGVRRDDEATLARLVALEMAVRVDREGTVIRDYHTAGGGIFAGREHGVWTPDGRGVTAVTERFYLADASFVVALGTNDHGLVGEIAAALEEPRWPLFLGRRACVPSCPVYLGVTEAAPADAVRRARPRCEQGDLPPRLRLVLEAGPEDGRPRNDVPVRFTLYEREHRLRHVRYEYMERDELFPETQ
jgi:CRISPR system Cascade subunit CasD